MRIVILDQKARIDARSNHQNRPDTLLEICDLITKLRIGHELLLFVKSDTQFPDIVIVKREGIRNLPKGDALLLIAPKSLSYRRSPSTESNPIQTSDILLKDFNFLMESLLLKKDKHWVPKH
jgi:hypothetical protein